MIRLRACGKRFSLIDAGSGAGRQLANCAYISLYSADGKRLIYGLDINNFRGARFRVSPLRERLTAFTCACDWIDFAGERPLRMHPIAGDNFARVLLAVTRGMRTVAL